MSTDRGSALFVRMARMVDERGAGEWPALCYPPTPAAWADTRALPHTTASQEQGRRRRRWSSAAAWQVRLSALVFMATCNTCGL
jgi:hypothetical protein